MSKGFWTTGASALIAIVAFAGCVGGPDDMPLPTASATGAPWLAFVANARSNDISSYVINDATGALASSGAPVAAGSSPLALAVSASGKFAYVANFGSGTLAGYRIDPANGRLQALGAPVVTGPGPASIAMSPSGTFVYVASVNSGDVSVYAVNAANGELTAAGAPGRRATHRRRLRSIRSGALRTSATCCRTT